MKIYDSLLKHANSGIYPFHMPGHKRNTGFLSFNAEPATLDVTEIFGMDNLQNPSGIILETEKKAAAVFGADESYLLANGSTGGVISAIMSQCAEGDKIVIARNSHMSAYSAIITGRLEPVYIYPDVSPHGIAGPSEPSYIEKALEKNPDAKVVFITSPTYEGIVSNVSKIAEISHRHGAMLIVDEAHGAHFNFHEAFPKSAVSAGADIVVNSLHKTLPSLTQTALLHVKGKRVNNRLLRMYLNMINSSSPSYILLSSIDKCVDLLENKGDLFDCYVNRLNRFYEKAHNLGIVLLNEEYINREYNKSCGYKAFDKSKLVIITGETADTENILREKYKIQLEACTQNYMIAMTSVADTDEGFERLIKALEAIISPATEPAIKFCRNYPKAEISIPPHKALRSNFAVMPAYKAKDCICAGFITPYPPGIPAVIPGEILTSDIIESLPAKYKYKEVAVAVK